MGQRTNTSAIKKAACSLLLGAVACAQPDNGAYEFALVGDNPYSPAAIAEFRLLIEDVNDRADLQWVLHVGDIRGGGPSSEPCTDEVLQGRFDLYQGFAMPFIYTPGDNDWFDCRADYAGGYDEYERLDFVRSLFYPDPTKTSGGRSMAVRSQSSDPNFGDFVENVLWTHGEVVYATVHLVSLTRAPTDPDIAALRVRAAVAWIDEAFRVAREAGSAGVFIATQVDPWAIWGMPFLVERQCETCLAQEPGLEPLYEALLRESTTFPGPVVLAVGDTHIFRVDKPLYRDDGTLVENFTRVEAFGSPNVHWIRVTVDPTERGVFTFREELVPGNIMVAVPQ